MKGAFIMSHRTKRSPEEKAAVIQRYLRGEISAAMAAEIAELSNESFLTELYNSGKNFNKTSGGSRMMNSRKTTLEERIRIAKDCIESGYDCGSIAKKYDVAYQQVYTWVKKYTKLGNAGL